MRQRPAEASLFSTSCWVDASATRMLASQALAVIRSYWSAQEASISLASSGTAAAGPVKSQRARAAALVVAPVIDQSRLGPGIGMIGQTMPETTPAWPDRSCAAFSLTTMIESVSSRIAGPGSGIRMAVQVTVSLLVSVTGRVSRWMRTSHLPGVGRVIFSVLRRGSFCAAVT